MKKTYSAPNLTSHGTVEKLTNFTGGAGTDTLFGPPQGTTPVATSTGGSLDACITPKGGGPACL